MTWKNLQDEQPEAGKDVLLKLLDNTMVVGRYSTYDKRFLPSNVYLISETYGDIEIDELPIAWQELPED
jgi:hypothetical protein